jgi:ankyrin repeat protein
MLLLRAIISNNFTVAQTLISSSPTLATEHLTIGATRQNPNDFYFPEIAHYLMAGDTPLHAAAVSYRPEIARELLRNGADARSRNRRGAEPLHYAADGGPMLPMWNPAAQGEIIRVVIGAGADPNAVDKSGVAPLHRAVRHRCSSAVASLLMNGASIRLKNGRGSTPLHLAVQNTGKGGTGSAESKTLQKEIIQLLLKAGADPNDRDERGNTVWQCAKSEWIRSLL